MAKKEIPEDEEDVIPTRSKKKSSKNKSSKVALKDETRQNVWGIVFLVLGLFVLLSVFRMAGVAGEMFYKGLSSLLGLGYYLLPVLLGVVGVSLMRKERPQVARLHAITGLLVLLSALGIMDIASNGSGESTNIVLGGYMGSIVAWPFVKLFGIYAGILLLGAILIVSLIVLFDESPNLMTMWNKTLGFFKKDITLPKIPIKSKI